MRFKLHFLVALALIGLGCSAPPPPPPKAPPPSPSTLPPPPKSQPSPPPSKSPVSSPPPSFLPPASPPKAIPPPSDSPTSLPKPAPPFVQQTTPFQPTATITPLLHPSYASGWRNTANSKSQVGTNLAQVADWSTEYPFVNVFKQARPWFSGTLENWEDGGTLLRDVRGNVRTLNANQVARSVIFAGSPADPGLSDQIFDVYFSGDGDIQWGNVDVLARARGMYTIKLRSKAITDDLIVIAVLTRTNPLNYLRDIRMLPRGGICIDNPFIRVPSSAGCSVASNYRSFLTYHQAITFNPEFLSSLSRYSTIRFMDWMRTNNSPQMHPGRRALVDHQFWTYDEFGVPWEVMIALANVLNINPWFCVPHQATDVWVKQFALTVKMRLDTPRKACVEYSNEVWNGIFDQTWYAIDQGKAQGLNMPENNDYIGMARFYSKRAQQIFDIFVATMESTSRVHRVMATQAVVPFYTDTILSYGNAKNKTDSFAVAPYFGDTLSSPEQVAAIKRLGVTGVFNWLNGLVSEPALPYGTLAQIDRVVRQQVIAAKAFGKPLVAYEGGQHFLAVAGYEWDSALNAILDSVNRDSRMKTVYLRYLNFWKSRTNNGLFNHYVNCDRWSEWGRWGAREYPTQPLNLAPKLDALMAHITAAQSAGK